MKELIIILSLISLLSISSALPHFIFNEIKSFHDCSGEKERLNFYIIGSLSEEIGFVYLPHYHIRRLGEFVCFLSKNEGEKDPAKSHKITCTTEGIFIPNAYFLHKPEVNGFDFLNEEGESTWPDDADKTILVFGQCTDDGFEMEPDEDLFSGNTQRIGLFASGPDKDIVKTIRKDVVDKALKSLPERSKTTKMYMMTRMQIAKIDYNLSDIEAAYMVYKWEYENLKYDCYTFNRDLDKIDYSEDGTYNSGVGACEGFTRLFTRFCEAMNIEAYQVDGLCKESNFNPERPPDDIYHSWNAIKIDGNFYLIDPTWGIGT